MVTLKLNIAIMLNIVFVSYCDRRIKGGEAVTGTKRYVAYLVKAPMSSKKYDSWVCGGAIVSTLFIITSAACVDDVEYLYAVAGYKKYVTDQDIETDQCTKTMKKKVIYTCVPMTRCSDNIRKVAGSGWMRRAEDRAQWRAIGEAYVHQWTAVNEDDDDVSKEHSISKINNNIHHTLLRNRKNKIRVQPEYELNYHQVEKWSYIDIAVVKVESPYDFNDSQYETLCSYKPKVIGVNYEKRFQDPGIDGLVYGWGHLDIWRQITNSRSPGNYEYYGKPPLKMGLCSAVAFLTSDDDKIQGDTKNYNQEALRYASVKVIDKSICKMEYSKFPNMNNVIDEFMICTEGKGEIDENGNLALNDGNDDPKLNGCKNPLLNLNCDQETLSTFTEDETRREVLRSANQTSNDHKTNVKNGTLSSRRIRTRRTTGICQNDHGGPLVTWAGANEVLIGVASVFKVTTESTCTGPYLYTSTRCNGMFLHCILSSKTRRRSICDSPPIQRGYETVEKFVSWKNHPAGPAQNEIEIDNREKDEENKKIYKEFAKLDKFSDNQMIALRPQMPINKT
ncbi:unnamed protein product [Spodoptera littoralis]|uniref:Peptidase S1 domain-containing protein n=1 Tax=Spodoptera littoralis TaxID=7109 RepID=A0A9P0I8W0_SPOLI|nr:unnamed protein product [Spodoptera littoralis]CAH1641526.1 unnamed protein product [Spodoptera littoralis]